MKRSRSSLACAETVEDNAYMKKVTAFLAVLLLLLSVLCFASCDTVGKGDKKSIVCTAFAQYDFALNILGEKAEDFNVEYLLEGGTDMHSYSNSVSVSDKVKILSSELFICIGGESEAWIDELLDDEDAENVRVLSLVDNAGEPICHEKEENHDHGHDHECDEHIWLSPKRAVLMCDAICEEICAIDPENADLYRENSIKYKKKLEKLDEDYKSTVSSAKNDYLVFADRFPFIYLTSDYGINYSAAFDGCSTETNATFETVTRLVKDINDNRVSTLITLEKSTVDITGTLIKESGRSDITVESVISMQNVSKKDIEGGMTYLSAMYENLEVFGKAMN